MQLTVLLSTRNNAGMLKDFLSALKLCSRPDSWEVVIVDNASGDETRNVIEEFRRQLPLRYYFQPVPGKSVSLNMGLSQARGEIVLFTDDDVVPDREWMLSHIRAMEENPEINIVGGRIFVNRKIMPGWLARSYNLRGILVSEHDRGDTPALYADGDYPFGPNMSVRKKRLESLNSPWPEDIGPGTGLPVGDETAFCREISGLSDRDRLYDPSCVVEHRPRIGKNFFMQSIRRSFLGGYAGAVHLQGLSRPQGKQGSLMKYTGWYLFNLGSVQEFFCVGSRVLGYLCGKMKAG